MTLGHLIITIGISQNKFNTEAAEEKEVTEKKNHH